MRKMKTQSLNLAPSPGLELGLRGMKMAMPYCLKEMDGHALSCLMPFVIILSINIVRHEFDNISWINVILGTYTGNPKAKANWKGMVETPDKFFSKECLPENFAFKDPSHFQKEEAAALLDFWYERQESGKLGFQFTGCRKEDFIKEDYRRKEKSSANEKPKKPEDIPMTEKGKGLAKAKDPIDIIDANAPFSMLQKSHAEKLEYLRGLSINPNYQMMVDTLLHSDEVFIIFNGFIFF